jgi:hypothetical protein
MQEVIKAIIFCSLALLAILVPAAMAEDSQNATVNQTINQTANLTINQTANQIAGQTINQTINGTAETASQPNGSSEAIILGSGKAISHDKVLRAGFENTKPMNDLDVYGNRSIHDISVNSTAGAPFDISQRVGNVSEFSYNSVYKPLYNISEYSRTKPAYQTPQSLASRSVYNISGYPEIMTANNIP